MKKLFYTLILLPLINYAQCIIPPHFYGNTGSNMTVMLTSNFINSIPISDPNSYVVAVTTNWLVVGSSLVYDVSQTSIAIWGDDSNTSELDGATFGESILFQLVDGEDLYEITIEETVNYSSNELHVLNTVTPSPCEDESNFWIRLVIESMNDMIHARDGLS